MVRGGRRLRRRVATEPAGPPGPRPSKGGRQYCDEDPEWAAGGGVRPVDRREAHICDEGAGGTMIRSARAADSDCAGVESDFLRRQSGEKAGRRQRRPPACPTGRRPQQGDPDRDDLVMPTTTAAPSTRRRRNVRVCYNQVRTRSTTPRVTPGVVRVEDVTIRACAAGSSTLTGTRGTCCRVLRTRELRPPCFRHVRLRQDGRPDCVKGFARPGLPCVGDYAAVILDRRHQTAPPAWSPGGRICCPA